VPEPRQVVAIGLNYRGHAVEAGMPVPDVPVVFGKFPTCIAGPTGAIEIRGDSIDWEAELVVVIGRRARDVAPGDGWAHVAGLTVGQDISNRALQFAGPVAQLTLAKSSPTFGPTGPVLVTPDELPNRDRLGIRCALGDRVVQSATTDDLVFGVDRLVAYVSSVIELLPGDLIFTGTPAGCGVSADPPRFLRPGDRLVTEIDGIGRMVHHCVAAPTPEQE
jgi:2-keto-4-pentenoate hydratase/2-oxohepta-3-ene-1,7-dioic acid hydratase in catechol pathway